MNVLTIFSNICLCTTKILFGIILLLPKELPLKFSFPLGLQIMIFFFSFCHKSFYFIFYFFIVSQVSLFKNKAMIGMGF